MMKTIEERAREYQRSDEDDGTTASAFEAGAEWMRSELTRWHDPEEELPEPGKKVLVKCVSGEIQTDFYEPELDGFFIEHATYAKVVGWREIHG